MGNELVVIFVIIFVIYGAGWIWQTVSDIVRDVHRPGRHDRLHGQAASSRSSLGGHDVARLRETYQRFADLCQGQVHDRQLFESPKVSFTQGGSRALLSIYESSDPAPQFYTQLTFTLPAGWPHRLEVFPQRFQDGDARGLNVNDIKVGDPGFDPRYVVKSGDAAFAREFLDAASRQGIEDLRNLLGNDRILVSVNSSRLMVRKQSVLGEINDLTVFADLAGRLYERLWQYWQRASGIEILEDDTLGAAAEDPVCQICGSRIVSEDRVTCRRCRTPHHGDCWEFNGQCSTYACGEKRCLGGV